jgi:uncharacterized protein YrrD
MLLPLTKGTPVVSLADGATLGAIEHVYFDPARRAVVGFTFHERGWLFGGPSVLVETADVHAFGPNAVTIEDASVVRSEGAIAAWHGTLLDLEALLTRTVITEGGRRLGQVSAIEFSPVTYRLIALKVTAARDPRARRIPAHDIQTIGEECIVVADLAVMARQPAPRPRQATRVLPFDPSSAMASSARESDRLSA